MTSTILSQNMRFDKHMKIGNLSVYFSDFTSNGIRFISSMVYIKAKYKSWNTTKYGYNLINKKKKKSMHPASDS